MTNYEIYNALYAMMYKKTPNSMPQMHYGNAMVGLADALQSSCMSEQQIKDICHKIINDALENEKALHKYHDFDSLEVLKIEGPLIANAIEDDKAIKPSEKDPYSFRFKSLVIADDLHLLMM